MWITLPLAQLGGRRDNPVYLGGKSFNYIHNPVGDKTRSFLYFFPRNKEFWTYGGVAKGPPIYGGWLGGRGEKEFKSFPQLRRVFHSLARVIHRFEDIRSKYGPGESTQMWGPFYIEVISCLHLCLIRL
jgi:hypothetical protein